MWQRLTQLDTLSIVAVALLLATGIVALYSVLFLDLGRTDIFQRHIVFSIMSASVMLGVGVVAYDAWRRYSSGLYIASLFVLVGVLFFGTVQRGTAGWIDLGVIVVQPVEIIKVFLIIFLANFIATKRQVFGERTVVIASFCFTALLAGLVLLQPDLGSAVILLGTWFGMILVSGIKKRYVLALVAAGSALAVCGWFFLAPYQQERILTFIDPERDAQGSGYNVIQSVIAVGNGGLWGQGIGRGTQSQLNFLPEQHTDFVFASFIESLGFVGGFFVLMLFGILFYRLQAIAYSAKDSFGYFITAGVLTMISLHVVINTGMNIGIAPVTGIPLPFLSAGGSALLSMGFAVGLAMSVYQGRSRTLER